MVNIPITLIMLVKYAMFKSKISRLSVYGMLIQENLKKFNHFRYKERDKKAV